MRSVLRHGIGKIMAGVAVTMLAGGGFAVAAAGPASATSCSSESICFYENSGFGGAKISIDIRNIPSGACLYLPGDWNDRISSIMNNTPRNIVFFADTGCSGANFTSPPRANHVNLGLNDAITSYRV